jgi:hypothetical protein
MGSTQRTRALAVAAVAVASAAVLAAYLGGADLRRRTAEPAPAQVAQSPKAANDGNGTNAPSGAVRTVAQPQPAAAPSTCPEAALVQPLGAHDGLFRLEPALSPDARTSALVAVAREAQQQGRMRDAEVALIAACHAAEREAGARSAPTADVKSQLGQHYVDLAAREGADAQRDEMHHRAETLWSQSAEAYAAALGRNASKTRIAQRRLASLAQAAPQPASPATASMGAARSISEPTERAARALPSVSVPALARSDPELAQLESDLERLRAQASRVSRDPAGMRRRDAQALAQRDARCQDKSCLLRWYAQRRRQLLAEF